MAQQQWMSPQRYFLGTLLTARPDWEQFFAEPVATRSSKPDSVAKEIAEKQEKRRELAWQMPVAATVTEAILLDSAGRDVFSGVQPNDALPGNVSARLMAILATLFQSQQLLSGNPTFVDVGVRLFGLRIRDRLRVVALDALRYGVLTGEPVETPVGLWYHRPFEPAPYCDPYEAIVPTESRNDISYDCACDFLGIEVPTVSVDNNPRVQAELARKLAIKAQLFPPVNQQ